MKRLLVLLLMVVLPMQIVWASIDGAWAAAGALTASVAHSAPSGHHAHEYSGSVGQPQAAAPADAARPGLTGLAGLASLAGLTDLDADDPDCDYCHHSAFSVLFLRFHFTMPATALPPHAAPLASYRSFIADISHPPDIRA